MDEIAVIRDAVVSSMVWAVCVTLFLVYRSLSNYTRTGPRIREEIATHYAGFARLAFLRLALWVWLISFFISLPGTLAYLSLSVWMQIPPVFLGFLLASVCSFSLIVSYQFLSQLLFIPSSIQASAQFRFSRLVPLWKKLRPFYFQIAYGLLFLGSSLLLLAGTKALFDQERFFLMAFLWTMTAGYFFFYLHFLHQKTVRPCELERRDNQGGMNVLMIGTDTLREDRLSKNSYHRHLTPFIESLMEQGTYFSNCYTSVARTAPALATLLTGLWPQHHRIRDNYPDADALTLPVKTLVETLGEQGYETAAIADWAGGDLGKIRFGFKKRDLPDDQWNLKYLIRQGPGEIRLFLSLFTHNRFGKRFLPEIYYLAGVPLTKDLTERTKQEITECAKTGKPFFITSFFATTHVPFGSDYPYYDMFTDKDYEGQSRYTMTKLATPEEIIKKQELGPEAYDVEQILNLYDGCVMQFDDSVHDIMTHLDQCGLRENTIVVIYSDHGADFFETGCWGQGNTLFGDDPSNRIPLLIVDPRYSRGQTVKQITRAVDFIPTLSGLLNIDLHESLDGQNLVPLFENPEADMQLPAFQETGIWLGKVPNMYPGQLHYPNMIELLDIQDKGTGSLSIKKDYDAVIMRAKNRSIRQGKWKLVCVPTETGTEYLLFDMETDPACQHDVKTEYADDFLSLKKRLDDWISLDQPEYIPG